MLSFLKQRTIRIRLTANHPTRASSILCPFRRAFSEYLVQFQQIVCDDPGMFEADRLSKFSFNDSAQRFDLFI